MYLASRQTYRLVISSLAVGVLTVNREYTRQSKHTIKNGVLTVTMVRKKISKSDAKQIELTSPSKFF